MDREAIAAAVRTAITTHHAQTREIVKTVDDLIERITNSVMTAVENHEAMKAGKRFLKGLPAADGAEDREDSSELTGQ